MLGWLGYPPGPPGAGDAIELFIEVGPLPSEAPLAGRGGIETLPSLDWPMAGDMDRELDEPVGDGDGLGLGEGDGLGLGEDEGLTPGSALSGLPSSLPDCPPSLYNSVLKLFWIWILLHHSHQVSIFASLGASSDKEAMEGPSISLQGLAPLQECTPSGKIVELCNPR